MFRKRSAGMLLGVSVLALASSAVLAQSLDEVVVTAQKRSQSAQDVPISINAISGDAIARAGVTDVNGIVDLVPGLNSRSDGPTQTVFAMRGVGTNAFGVGVDGSVGVFVDDVFIGHPVLVNTSFFDVERVEVVKGPQGTLFGRNTSAGAISAVSKKGEMGSTYYDAQVGFGNEGQRRYQFIANISSSDNFAIRLAGRVQERDGTFQNTTTGNELNNVDNQIFRLVASFNPSDKTAVNFIAENYQDDSYWGMANMTYVDANGDDAFDRNRMEVSSVTQNARDHANVDSTRLALSVEHELSDQMSITWNINKLDIESVAQAGDFLASGDYTPDLAGLSVLDFSEPGDFEFFATEARLNSTSDGVSWFIGASYRDDTLTNNSTLRYDDEHLDALLAGGALGLTSFNAVEESPTTVDVKSYAIFGDISFDISDRLTATVGGRYSDDEKDISVNVLPTTGNAGFNVLKPNVGSDTAKESWSETTSRFALNYDLSDNAMAYVSYSEGFKSGGFNSSLDDNLQILAVEPEKHDAIEIGVKSELMDRRLRLNLAYFTSEYEDYQIEVQQGAAFVIRNIADADIDGFEIDGAWLLSDNFELQFALSSLDTEITSGILPTDTDGDGAVDTQVNVAGNDMPFAPDLSYTLALNYSRMTNMGELGFNISYAHTDKQYHTAYNDDDFGYSEENDLVDVRLQLTAPNDSWRLALLGKNITDERYLVSTNPVVFNTGVPNMGSLWSVELGYRF